MPARSTGLASPFPARVASLCASQLALMSLLLDLRPIWLKTEMELLSEVAEILKTHTGAPAIRERLPASPTFLQHSGGPRSPSNSARVKTRTGFDHCSARKWRRPLLARGATIRRSAVDNL